MHMIMQLTFSVAGSVKVGIVRGARKVIPFIYTHTNIPMYILCMSQHRKTI